MPNNKFKITLEGRLYQGSIAMLLESVSHLPSAQTLELDVSSLVWLDETGARTLLSLQQQGANIVGGSLYVRRVLQEVST
ncbi:MAG: hypothetical protein U0640_15390 [Phycisphaerales bacterium]